MFYRYLHRLFLCHQYFLSIQRETSSCLFLIMLSLSDNNQADSQADVVEAFISTSRYLDDFLNIDNHYFEQMVQLNKANSSDTEASITNRIVSSKNFEIVNFSFSLRPCHTTTHRTNVCRRMRI